MGKASFRQVAGSFRDKFRCASNAIDCPKGVYQAFKKWDVGDIVGASGELFKTPRPAN